MNTNYQIQIIVNTGRPYPLILWDDFSAELPMGVSFDGVIENAEIVAKISEIAENIVTMKSNAVTPDERRAAWSAKQKAETKIFEMMKSLRVQK